MPGHGDHVPMLSALQKKIHTAHTFFFFFLFTATLWHMEVPRLGVEVELQLKPTPQPCRILSPLSKAGDGTCILMDTMLGPQPAAPQQELYS